MAKTKPCADPNCGHGASWHRWTKKGHSGCFWPGPPSHNGTCKCQCYIPPEMVRKVKRPYMRSVPCAVECRADGKAVYAAIGNVDGAIRGESSGVIGFGNTLPDALRSLADAIEKEVEVTGDEQLPN